MLHKIQKINFYLGMMNHHLLLLLLMIIHFDLQKKKKNHVPYFLLLDFFRPTYSTAALLDKTGLTLNDIDCFEIHEAFAVSFFYIFY